MNLTPYARYLIAKHEERKPEEERTPEEKRRAYKREWTRKKRAMAGVAAVHNEDSNPNGG